MRQPRHLFFHQACAAYSRITLGLCFSKRGVQGVDVSLHGPPHLLRLLLLLGAVRSNLALQSLDVGDGPAPDDVTVPEVWVAWGPFTCARSP
jgi:hypothetical protein